MFNREKIININFDVHKIPKLKKGEMLVISTVTNNHKMVERVAKYIKKIMPVGYKRVLILCGCEMDVIKMNKIKEVKKK